MPFDGEGDDVKNALVGSFRTACAALLAFIVGGGRMLDVDVGVLDLDGVYEDAEVEDVAVDGRFGYFALGVGNGCRRELVRCISVGEVVNRMSVGIETDIDGCSVAAEDVEDEDCTSMVTEGFEDGLAETTISELPEPEVLLLDSSALVGLDSTPWFRMDERYESPLLEDRLLLLLCKVAISLPSCSDHPGKLRSSSTTSNAAPGFITRVISLKRSSHCAQKELSAWLVKQVAGEETHLVLGYTPCDALDVHEVKLVIAEWKLFEAVRRGNGTQRPRANLKLTNSPGPSAPSLRDPCGFSRHVQNSGGEERCQGLQSK